MTYGLMTETDFKTMDRTLELVCEAFPEGIINTLELGVHKGYTSRGIRDFFKSKNRVNFHTGIDNQHDLKMGAPFPECNFIIGNTMEVYNQIRDRSIHFLFIDACHNFPTTMLDFLLYKNKVVKNGFLAFHDTSPFIKPMTDYQGMGSKEDPHMYISCREALKHVGLYDGLWDYELAFEQFDKHSPTGGISVFQKTR